MHAIRRAARAINRRATWQVLAAYLLGAWILLLLVRWGTALLGLPAWTPTMALVLLLAMMPLFVATAVVQGGLPGLRIEDEVDPNDLLGLTPEQVHVVPEAHPLYETRLFTWRNMVLGGVTSAALLVTSVVAYLAMWALGIGPVGSLMAQGIIGEQDVVALTPLDNLTDDPSLGAVVTDAVGLELSRSWTVAPSEPDSIAARLVVSGAVSRRGRGYALSSSIALPSGAILARFEESASGELDLLVAVERLAERVRQRLGESLRAIREGERLSLFMTPSAEALRLYDEAARSSTAGDMDRAMDLLRESLSVDPSFAMAWRRLGVLAEMAGDAEEARNAYQRVVDLWAPYARTEHTVAHMRERLAALE